MTTDTAETSVSAPVRDPDRLDGSTPQSWWVFSALGLTYLVVALLGRASALEHGAVSLVWPAAGVAFLWLLHQSGTARSVVCLLVMALALASAMLLTGASVALTVAAVCAGLAQSALAVALVRRWCPGLLGAGGTTSMHTLRVLALGTTAVLVASALGAAIGTVGLAVDTGAPQVWDFVSWWVRNFAGFIIVGTVGHLLWEQQRGDRARRMTRPDIAELSLLLAVSAVAYGLIFTQPGLPLVFLGIPLSVWAALRFPTVLAACHTVVMGSAAVLLTLNGLGPFGDIARPEVAALVVEAFLLTSMMTALTIGIARDERAVLIAELAASEQAAGERAELLDAMTEAMTEGLAVVDSDGRIVRMNAACRAMLELTAQGMDVNARSYELRQPGGAPLSPDEYPYTRAFREGVVPAHDIHLVVDDGTVRILSVNAAALTGGRVRGARTSALVVYRDVTGDRQDRSKLADFASTVAHDLRSPLTAVGGWLDLASEQLKDAANEPGDTLRVDVVEASHSIARAQTASMRMSTLIQELLSQATAEGKQLELESLELSGPGGLVQEIGESLPGATHLVVGDIPRIEADEDLVRQLLSNLLGNAAKYADPDRPARVLVTGAGRHQRVHIDVTDNGVGVPSDQRERVFTRFHRAHAGDRRFSGTGLGLALCQTIVERHGGIIECLPTSDGVGTTFRFDLPASPTLPAQERE